jgi:predicted dinucleotide-binding enzyme
MANLCGTCGQWPYFLARELSSAFFSEATHGKLASLSDAAKFGEILVNFTGLNTISKAIMVKPGAIAHDHDLLMAGNDAEAKVTVTALVKKEFGWKSVIDLGDISGARGTEHILPLWVRLWGVLGTPAFNIKIVKW